MSHHKPASCFAVCRLWLARRVEGLRQRADELHAHQEDCSALCCAKVGQTARVVRFCDEHEAARLRDLGLVEGAQVSVMRDGDPLLVRVGDTRFGIGRAAAMNVLCHLDN